MIGNLPFYRRLPSCVARLPPPIVCSSEVNLDQLATAQGDASDTRVLGGTCAQARIGKLLGVVI
jgi:hypothetical protein